MIGFPASPYCIFIAALDVAIH